MTTKPGETPPVDEAAEEPEVTEEDTEQSEQDTPPEEPKKPDIERALKNLAKARTSDAKQATQQDKAEEQEDDTPPPPPLIGDDALWGMRAVHEFDELGDPDSPFHKAVLQEVKDMVAGGYRSPDLIYRAAKQAIGSDAMAKRRAETKAVERAKDTASEFERPSPSPRRSGPKDPELTGADKELADRYEITNEKARAHLAKALHAIRGGK